MSFVQRGYSDSFPVQWGPQPDGYYNVHPNGTIKNATYSFSESPITGDIIAGCEITTTSNPGNKMVYYSSDGSYLRLEYENNGRWTVFFPNGSKLVQELDQTQYIYDRNGNSVHTGTVTLPDSSSAGGWIDEFGRYTARKLNAATNEDHIYNLGFNGQLLTTRIIWKDITVIRQYRTEDTSGNGYHGSYSYQMLIAQPRVVDKIILPAEAGGLDYTFDYNAHDGIVAYDPNNPNYSPGWGQVKIGHHTLGSQIRI